MSLGNDQKQTNIHYKDITTRNNILTKGVLLGVTGVTPLVMFVVFRK
jgi:hypothetical protein